jgi:hypothetical protein
MMSENAFIAGNPVRGPDYFGRMQLLRHTEEYLRNGHVILIGERRIGKTSTLMQIERRLVNTSELSMKPVTVNVGWISGRDQEDSTPAIIHEIASSLYYWGNTQSDLIRKITKVLNHEQIDANTLISCLRQLGDEVKRIVFLIDEVDSSILQAPAVGSILRAISQSDNIRVLATSFREPHTLEIHNHFGSPWFNVFNFVYISLFDNDEARELLMKLSERSGSQFTESECSLLMEVFGNFPYFLQMAGHYIFRDGDFATIPMESRIGVIRKSILSVGQQLEHLFPYTVSHIDPVYLPTLLNIARGKRISSDNKSAHSRYLERRGLVVEKNNNLCIYSRVFQEFLLQIPEPSIAQKIGQSDALKTMFTAVGKMVETALSKAIEVGMQKYF